LAAEFVLYQNKLRVSDNATLLLSGTVDNRGICLRGRSMSKIRTYSILRVSGTGVLQRLAQLLSSLINPPVALHSLVVAGFGVWGAATSLAWLSSLLTLVDKIRRLSPI
jgi:hypothetical protein